MNASPSQTPGVHLAVAQTVPIDGSLEANRDEHLRLAGIGCEAGANLILFPELSLTGYVLRRAAELACEIDDPRFDALSEFAAGHNATLAVGAPLTVEGRCHIATLILGPDGTRTAYTKQRLGAFGPDVGAGLPVPPAEAEHFSPGTLDPSLPLGEHEARLAICADVGDPAHARRAAERGARIYLASMFLVPNDFAKESTNLASYAKRHSLLVAAANYGGPSAGLPSAGKSSVFTPKGELLVSAPADGPAVLLVRESLAGWQGERLFS